MSPPPVEEVRSLVEEAAEEYLSGPTTVELTEWDDGDYQIAAFSTIDATYPFEEEAETPGGLDGDDALPFYRERVYYSTTDHSPDLVRLQVVRRRTGRTGGTTVYETPVAFVGPRDSRTADAGSRRGQGVVQDLDLGLPDGFGGGPPPAAPAATVQVNGTPVGRVESLNVTVENSLSPVEETAVARRIREANERKGGENVR